MCTNLREVWGVLGNKCAGWHNLKTVYFKLTVVIFWLGHRQCECFLAALCLPHEGSSELICSDIRQPPTSSSWRCPGSISSLQALISHSVQVKRLVMRNMANSEAGRTSWHLFIPPITDNSGGHGFLGDGLAKDKFCANVCTWAFKLNPQLKFDKLK